MYDEEDLMLSKLIQDDIVTMLKNCQFRPLCDKYFDTQFHWVIKGTSEFSGEYFDKDKFFTNIIDRLNSLIAPGWKMHILNTYCDNEKRVFIVEMQGEAKTHMGGNYNNQYCWIFQFDSLFSKVTKLTAYYDGLLVNNTLNAARLKARL